MKSQLKKILAKTGSKVVSAIPIGTGGALVFTDDGQVYRLSGIGADCYIATEQWIGREAGTGAGA